MGVIWASETEHVEVAISIVNINPKQWKLPQSRFRTSAGWCSARVPGAAQHEAQRNDALQTRDRFSLRRSRISGASLHFVTRCTASGTHDRDRPIRHLLSHDIKQPSSFPRRVFRARGFASLLHSPRIEGWAERRSATRTSSRYLRLPQGTSKS